MENMDIQKPDAVYDLDLFRMMLGSSDIKPDAGGAKSEANHRCKLEPSLPAHIRILPVRQRQLHRFIKLNLLRIPNFLACAGETYSQSSTPQCLFDCAPNT